MTSLNNLSEIELQSMIKNAETALKDKQVGKRKEVCAKIKELAASIGATVDINYIKSDKVVNKVAPKYRNPNDEEQVWTGRGMQPRWFAALLDNGSTKEDLLI